MTLIFTTLSATILMQIGYFLWKLSAPEQPKIGKASLLEVIHSFITNTKFIAGYVTTCIGWILFMYAVSLGDISLVQPLMSAGEFFLVLLAVIFLKERLTKSEWIGVCISVLGTIVLSFQGEYSSSSTVQNEHFIIFSVCFLAVALLLSLLHFTLDKAEILLSFLTGMSFSAGAILTKILTETVPIFSVHTLLEPLLYAMIGMNILGIVLLQSAFQHGRASVVVPVQIAITNVCTVIAGVYIFSEHITFLRSFGITLIIIGTVLLQFKKKE